MRVDYNDSNIGELLLRDKIQFGTPGCLGRKTSYGSVEAIRCGLIPIEEYPDQIPDWKDAKEIIQHCNEKKIFPEYHTAEHGLLEYWSQNGTNFCWAYSAVSALMACRDVEGQPPIELGPESLGWLVNWRNAGYWLEPTLEGMRDQGVAPREYIPEHRIGPRYYKDGWEEERRKYRALEWWDTRYQSPEQWICHCLAQLRTGHPGYAAWPGHAMTVMGMRWDEHISFNVIWRVRNSHKEKKLLNLSGRGGAPDTFFGLRASTHSGE